MWHYSGSIVDHIDQFPEGAIGFVYKITSLDSPDGKFYIGKKNIHSTRNIKLGKKELEAQAALKKPGKKLSKKKVVKESDWKTYYSSEPVLKEEVKSLGPSLFKREILEIAFSKKQLTYFEIKYQILHRVLESDNSYNNNISGHFFKKDLVV